MEKSGHQLAINTKEGDEREEHTEEGNDKTKKEKIIFYPEGTRKLYTR